MEASFLFSKNKSDAGMVINATVDSAIHIVQKLGL